MSLVKITTRIEEGDRETLQKFFPRHSYQEVMREIISRVCRRLNARAAEEMTIETMPQISLEDYHDPVT